ncbi:MAG TPA: hypothetical protein VFX13_11085 [Gaiellales bacterium]|nr:hypothetical protein [Gaiellales bacterium]
MPSTPVQPLTPEERRELSDQASDLLDFASHIAQRAGCMLTDELERPDPDFVAFAMVVANRLSHSPSHIDGDTLTRAVRFLTDDTDYVRRDA